MVPLLLEMARGVPNSIGEFGSFELEYTTLLGGQDMTDRRQYINDERFSDQEELSRDLFQLDALARFS